MICGCCWSWTDETKRVKRLRQVEANKNVSYPLLALVQTMAGMKGDEGVHLQGSTA